MLLVEEDQGKKVLWLKKPNIPLEKILQEINLIAYSKRAALLGIDEMTSEVKIMDNFVVERFKSDEEKLKYYSNMDLRACESFISKQEEACRNYLQLCENFTLTPANWSNYIDLASEVRSYILSGFSFRDYVNRRATRAAIELKIPKHYLEAYSEQLQSQTEEEDSLIVKAILELAKKVKTVLKDPSIDTLSLAELKEKAPALYQELEKRPSSIVFKKMSLLSRI